MLCKVTYPYNIHVFVDAKTAPISLKLVYLHTGFLSDASIISSVIGIGLIIHFLGSIVIGKFYR